MMALVHILKKGELSQLSPHLAQNEIDCKCKNETCVYTFISQRCVDAFEKTRYHLGKPIMISSGFRCIVHNKTVGGERYSDHTRGDALDMFPADKADLVELYEIALNYFDYCYPDFEKGFVHGSKRT